MSLDVQSISLDISKQPTPQQVRLGQGDANATQLIVSVFDDGEVYSLNDYSVRLAMRLPNSDNYYEAQGTASGNVATFDIDETYAATSYGIDGFGYVDVLDGETVICSTSRFQLVVLRDAQDGADPSTAYSSGIIEATNAANEAAASATSAAGDASDAADAANQAAQDATEAAEDAREVIENVQFKSTITANTPQTVTDALPAKPESADLYGKSVQNGTPTPSSPVPVQVVGGRNLAKPYSYSASVDGVTLQYSNNGSISVSSNATNNVYAPTAGVAVAQGFTYTLPAGTYTLSFSGNIGALNANVTNSSGSTLASVTESTPTATFTLTAPTAVFHRVTVLNGTTIDTTLAIQIEAGTTATPYVPYGCIGLQIGDTVTPIDMQGHTLASLPDGTRDVLHVDDDGNVTLTENVGKITFNGSSSETWNLNTSVGVGFAFAALPGVNSTNQANLLCDRFFARVASTIGGNVYISGTNALFFRTTGFEPTSSTEAKAWFAANHTNVVYPLATPATIDLGTITLPELAQTCVIAIYASLDPTWTITYERDPNVVIGRIESSIAPVEGAKASSNYSVGSYLVHGDRLYRVTSAIATGEAIVPGTNCTTCNVMAELIRLTA